MSADVREAIRDGGFTAHNEISAGGLKTNKDTNYFEYGVFVILNSSS